MIRQTQRVHQLLAEVVRPGESVVDATAGNGFDTVYLAQLVGPTGHVFAYDILQVALDATSRVLSDKGLSHATLILGSHAKLADDITGPIAAATFNLGYLPCGDRTITTQAESTVAALTAVSRLLRPGGIITIICYVGHAGGPDETAAVLAFGWALDPKEWTVDWSIESHPAAPRLCVMRKR